VRGAILWLVVALAWPLLGLGVPRVMAFLAYIAGAGFALNIIPTIAPTPLRASVPSR